MVGLDPAIHAFLDTRAWMPGTSSAKTRFAFLPGHDGDLDFQQRYAFTGMAANIDHRPAQSYSTSCGASRARARGKG